MAETNENGRRTFIAGEAIPAFRRVKLGADGEKVVLADAADRGVGVSTAPAFEAGKPVDVKLWSAPGTIKIEANGVIADKAVAFAGADGEVAPTGTVAVGYCNGAAQDGSINEVYPFGGGGGAGDAESYYAEHTVTAGEDTAGLVDLVSGLGRAFAARPIVQIVSSAGVIKTDDQVITEPSAGTVRIADGSSTALAAGDIITVFAK